MDKWPQVKNHSEYNFNVIICNYIRKPGFTMMKVQIIRIEENVVSCSLEDGHILDIDRKWLPEDIKENDELDFNVEVARK